MMKSIRLLMVAALAAAVASCGDVVRSSRSPVLVTVVSLVGGATAASQGNVVHSDVVITTGACSVASPCTLDDIGTATLATDMKNTTVAPTSNNRVIINRYHVAFTRADGHNVEGVDVPFATDGAATVGIDANSTGVVNFELVRNNAKREAPLVALGGTLQKIETIATVTFYGTDSVGNEVSAAGSMTVIFGNFSD